MTLEKWLRVVRRFCVGLWWVTASTIPPAALASSALHYSSDNFVARTRNSFNGGTPLVLGAKATSFSLIGTLPAGLDFNSVTGVISGTPTALLPPGRFVISAQNGDDVITTSFTLTAVNGTISLPLQGTVTRVIGFTSLAVQVAIDSASPGGTVRRC